MTAPFTSTTGFHRRTGMAPARSQNLPTPARSYQPRLKAPAAGGSGIKFGSGWKGAETSIVPQEKPRSFFNQVTDVLKGVPAGVGALAHQAWQTSMTPVRATRDLIELGVNPTASGNPLSAAFADGFDWSDIGELQEEYSPFTASMQHSLGQTGYRVIHPTQYARAIQEGRIVDVVLEDIGNVAMVAGGASKAIGSVAQSATVPVRVAAALEDAGMAARTGRSLGAAATAEDVGAFSARQLRKAGNAARRAEASLGPAPMMKNAEGALVPATRDIMLRGKGIAGALERAGYGEAAQTTARVGQQIGKAARLGEVVDDVQLAWPAKAVAKPLRYVSRRAGLPEFAARQIERISAGDGVAAKMARQFTEEGRAAAAVPSALNAEQTARTRQAMSPSRVAEDLGLTAEQRRTALHDVDQRFYNLVQRYKENAETFEGPGIGRFEDSTALNEMIDRSFEDMTPDRRPTPDDIRNFARTGEMTPELEAKLGMVAEAQRAQTGVRTERLIEQGRLNPEQTLPELRESRINWERSKLERGAERAYRDWETKEQTALRKDRIAAARVAINRSLPDMPDVEATLQAGVNYGRATERAKALQSEVVARQAMLSDAVDAYIKLDDADTPARRQAEREVERLTEQVDALQREVERQTRQGDAMHGLRRADVEEGRRPVESPGEARVDLREARVAVDDAKASIIRELENERDRIAGSAGAPTRVTRRQRQLGTGGEHDHWVFRPPSELTREQRNRIDRYERLGFVKRAGGRGADTFNPDQWVREAAGFADDLDVSEAMDQWFDLADRLDAAKRNGYTPDAIERAAMKLDMDPVLLDDALRSADTTGRGPTNRTSFRQVLMREVDEALSTIHDRYAALEPSVRQALDDALDDFARNPDDFDGADVFDVVETFVEGAGGYGGLFHRLGDGGITTEQALEFMRTGQITEAFYTAVQRAPSVAQKVQMGKLTGLTQGSRRRLADAVRSERGARETLRRVDAVEEAIATEAARQVDREAKALEQVEGEFYDSANDALDAADRAAEIADSATYEEVVIDKEGKERTVTRKPWKQTRGRDANGNVTNPLSPGGRALVNEGVLTSDAGRAATEANRAKRTYDRWNDRIAGLRGKLGKSWQDRMTDEVNVPAVSGMRRIVRSIAPEFGQLMEPEFAPDGSVLVGPRASGLMGRMADQYGFADELGMVLFDMRQDVNGRPLSAIDQAGAFFGVAKRNGVRFDQVAETALNDSWQADYLLEQIADIEYGAVDAGTRLNSPFRVIDLIEQQDWIPKKLPDDAGSQLRARADAYRRRRGNYLDRLMDDQLRAVPARFRAPLINARRDIATFVQMAEDWNKNVDGSGDVFLRMAEDSVSTLSDLLDAGVDPTHLIGGKVLDRPGGSGFGSGRALAERKTMAEREMGSGLRPMDLETYARTEAREAMTLLSNDTVKVIEQQFGQPASAVIGGLLDEHLTRTGRPMNAEQMTAAIDEAGYAPMSGAVTTQGTVVVPKSVVDEMKAWSDPGGGPMWQALRQGNRAFKTIVLPLSIRWHIGNIVGNALMAMVQGGLGPVELARTMQTVASSQGGWRAALKAEGMPWWAPDEMANAGLSYGEHQMLWQGMTVDTAQNRFQSLVAKSFHVNQFFDNMYRNSVYLAKLGKGVPTEVAMRQTLNAMGDYTRMTSFERRVVREVMPFYAWIRHQTQAALRLPLYSPTRAAYMYSLGNIFADEEMSPEALALLGSRVPLGGGQYLNLGNLNPFGNPLALPLNPSGTDFSRSISPVIGLPAKLVFGWDIDRQRAITRPADTAVKGVYGEEQTTSPVRRITEAGGLLPGLGEMAYMAAGEVPYLGQARNLVFSGTRYDTGQRRPVQHENRQRSLLTEVAPSILSLPALQSGVDQDIERVDEQFGGEMRRRRLAQIINQPQQGG